MTADHLLANGQPARAATYFEIALRREQARNKSLLESLPEKERKDKKKQMDRALKGLARKLSKARTAK